MPLVARGMLRRTSNNRSCCLLKMISAFPIRDEENEQVEYVMINRCSDQSSSAYWGPRWDGSGPTVVDDHALVVRVRTAASQAKLMSWAVGSPKAAAMVVRQPLVAIRPGQATSRIEQGRFRYGDQGIFGATLVAVTRQRFAPKGSVTTFSLNTN